MNDDWRESYWGYWVRHPLRMIWAGWEIRGWVGVGPFEKRRLRRRYAPRRIES